MDAEPLLVAALRGETTFWPSDAQATLADAVFDAAADHQVAALLVQPASRNGWPDRLQSALNDVRRQAAAREAVQRQDLSRLLDTFAEARVGCVLLKGAQLAYTHYPQPWLRPRFDTDLLIRPVDRDRADVVLRRLGYSPSIQVSGALVANQRQYQREDRYRLTDTIDLHWKITNPHVFADVLTFDELSAAARPVPQLGEHARGLANPHALILACVHRVAHHQNSDRLIWLYDIHLVARAMSTAEGADFVDLVLGKRLRSICVSGLERARQRFLTPYPAEWLERLSIDEGEASEPTAEFLRHGFRRVDILRSDLRSVGGWMDKMRLIREHLFPPAAYVRARYGTGTPLAVAYVDRVVTGMAKWFRAS